MTRSYKAEGESVNTVECEVFYTKGGINYFNYQNEPRGYYFSITACKITDVGNGLVCREFGMFSGEKTLVLPCQRQSKTRFESACSMMDELVERYLEDFCERKGIKILSEEFTVSVRDRAA